MKSLVRAVTECSSPV
uniref:Uncharacterized protein n=1 Tax=Anguilla anguilla TaxID=7936 RepID=A0A0E9R7P5_ANGAN